MALGASGAKNLT